MAKKIRKIVDGKVQWFKNPMLEIKDDESYIEAYKYRIFNLLSIIKGELTDKSYGIKGVFGKQNKQEIDLEVQQALYDKLGLTVTSYNSVVKDREYSCKFTVVTPKRLAISLEVNL